MTKHLFLFTPGQFIGQGKLSLSASDEQITFYTQWLVKAEKNGIIHCRQTVEMAALGENVENNLIISDIKEKSFTIVLENKLLGTAQGRGLLEEKIIAWEFAPGSGLDGFEVYTLQDNGDYQVHAEYASQDQLRTIIDGLIWIKCAKE